MNIISLSSGLENDIVNSKVMTLIGAGITAGLASLPLWFITLMAIIAGRSWSIASGLAALGLTVFAVFMGYRAYSGLEEEKREDARRHNMERQVLTLAKKNRGIVTVADLINVGFESSQAERLLDSMSKRGICDINLDATELSGIVTYSFPELIPLEGKKKEKEA